MLNVLRPAVARLLTPVGKALARTPVTPNAVTITGPLGVSAGALARIKGTTGVWGAFLDSTLDRVADASVFAGIAAWAVLSGHSRMAAGLAIFCLVAGALVSYVKARAEGLGVRCDVGIAERPERLVIGLVVIGLTGLGVPYVLAVGLWVLAVLSTVTLAQRVLAVRQATAGGGNGCPDSKTG